MLDALVLVHDHIATVALRVPNGAIGICAFIEFAGPKDTLNLLSVIVFTTLEASHVDIVDAFGREESRQFQTQDREMSR